MKRMWINQPSKLQPFHDLHGQRVLANFSDSKEYPLVYFTENGPKLSQIIPKSALSEGWPDKAK